MPQIECLYQERTFLETQKRIFGVHLKIVFSMLVAVLQELHAILKG